MCVRLVCGRESVHVYGLCVYVCRCVFYSVCMRVRERVCVHVLRAGACQGDRVRWRCVRAFGGGWVCVLCVVAVMCSVYMKFMCAVL